MPLFIEEKNKLQEENTYLKTLQKSQNDIKSNSTYNDCIQENMNLKKILEETKKPKKYKLKSKETEMNIISERLDDLRALDLYFSKGNKTVLDSSTFNEYYFKIKKILEKANNKIKESTINNDNKSGQQNDVKKIRKLSNKKISNKIIKRNNSDGFDVNNIKRLEESKTSKAFDIINKEKKRLSYFRLNFFNKTSNIFKNEDNKNNNNE